jgi:hypothetical protein
MPIKHGYSKGAIAHNIRVEQQMGRPHNQAVAIALAIRDRELKRKFYREHPGMSRFPNW